MATEKDDLANRESGFRGVPSGPSLRITSTNILNVCVVVVRWRNSLIPQCLHARCLPLYALSPEGKRIKSLDALRRTRVEGFAIRAPQAPENPRGWLRDGSRANLCKPRWAGVPRQASARKFAGSCLTKSNHWVYFCCAPGWKVAG